ncbi:MAG: DNA/RNA helicase [Deltaproteobacteria bacterium]|nr:DNA/RNA helicase [Deltaproteobacteria bacterium]
MQPEQVRDRIVDRLRVDLIGPGASDELISDRPTERYTTGILYPRDEQNSPEDDDNGGGDDDEEVATVAKDAAPMWAARKPATAGMSFALSSTEPIPKIVLVIRAGVYDHVMAESQASGDDSDGAGKGRWQRRALEADIPVDVVLGEQRLSDPRLHGMGIYVLAVLRDGLTTVTVALINNQTSGDSRAESEAHTFFQVELVVKPVPPTQLEPRPARALPLDEDGQVAALIYRDAVEYAVGHTCSATVDLDRNNRPSAVRTIWLPLAVVAATSEQGDVQFRALQGHPTLSPLRASWLADASIADLVAGLRLLEDAYRAWIVGQRALVPALGEQHQPQARKQIETCTTGADRIRDGIALLERDEQVRLAFQLSSRAMATQYRWSRGTELIWRPFQLAFQLLALPSLADRAHADRDVMDLLWFPTGGGKTEAYLGLTAFILILRRLRATKEEDGSGVAVLMRYTLRLLTIQQFQRAAAMVLACELLRRESRTGPASRDLGPRAFSIGLWVGQAATPSTIKEAKLVQPGSPSTYAQVTECPACQGRLAWQVTTKCVASCDSPTCELARTGRELPIWTVDEDIYREAPSLVIATVDKFAQIVRKMDSGILFGRGPSARRAPPDLIIQDELHLISGPLGTMTGLYETAIDALCERDGRRPKIIGSTATIRRASEQVRALFNRSTFQFPPPGIDASNSGFAVRDLTRPGRLYLGLTTAGRSAKYVLQAVAASLLQAATDAEFTPDERDWYWTLVAYFNSLRELGGALVLLQDDVPVTIKNIAARRSEVIREIQPPSELTSRRRSIEIRDMLDQLRHPAGHPEAVDSLLASNMISVGVDIQRLGLMVVNAQPKGISEYIQATSRVGRGAVPGLVLTIYNASRARDRSHFETFPTWHRTLYREVEATSVTPFASRAQDKALHAVLVALVRHLVPGMAQQPALDAAKRALVERQCAVIEQRALAADRREVAAVTKLLKERLDQWEQWWQPGAEYWMDFGGKRTLLMSAEQYAAREAEAGGAAGAGGIQQALWPTPNSMREVEPGTPFVLIQRVRVTEGT